MLTKFPQKASFKLREIIPCLFRNVKQFQKLFCCVVGGIFLRGHIKWQVVIPGTLEHGTPGTPRNIPEHPEQCSKARNTPEHLLENPEHPGKPYRKSGTPNRRPGTGPEHLKNALNILRKPGTAPANIYCHYFPLINETSASC